MPSSVDTCRNDVSEIREFETLIIFIILLWMDAGRESPLSDVHNLPLSKTNQKSA